MMLEAYLLAHHISTVKIKRFERGEEVVPTVYVCGITPSKRFSISKEGVVYGTVRMSPQVGEPHINDDTLIVNELYVLRCKR